MKNYKLIATCDNVSWPLDEWLQCSRHAWQSKVRDFEAQEHDLEPGTYVTCVGAKRWIYTDQRRMMPFPQHFGITPTRWWRQEHPMLHWVRQCHRYRPVRASILRGFGRLLDAAVHAGVIAGCAPLPSDEAYLYANFVDGDYKALNKGDQFTVLDKFHQQTMDYENPYFSLRELYRAESARWH